MTTPLRMLFLLRVAVLAVASTSEDFAQSPPPAAQAASAGDQSKCPSPQIKEQDKNDKPEQDQGKENDQNKTKDQKDKNKTDENQNDKEASLMGYVVDDDTGDGLANAVVLAACGTDPIIKRRTKTAKQGKYTFEQLPADSPCIIRAARTLSAAEREVAKAEFQLWRSYALPDAQTKAQSQKQILKGATASDQTVTALTHAIPAPSKSKHLRLFEGYKKSGQLAEQAAASCMGPDKWDYEERSIDGITVKSGDPTQVPTIRLPRRGSSVGEFARVLTGLEQTGASGADSTQKFFFDLFVSIPAPFQRVQAWHDANFGPPVRIWGDARITSAPQQITSSLGDFAVSFADQIANVPVNQVAQAAEFQIGVESRLVGWGGLRDMPFFSFDRSTRQRFGVYVTSSFGRITTLSPKSGVQIFNNPQPGTEPDFDQQIASLGLTNSIAGKKYVAFIPEDRLKFYKDYYAGLRFKTYYYDSDTGEPLRRFPASLDVVFGQNENVTGGRLNGVVARLDGFYPLPFDALRYIYLFGTADLLVGGKLGKGTILLQSATNAPALPNSDTYLIQSPPLSRDQYRLAVGVDILQLFDAIKNRNQNKPKAAQTGDSKPPATGHGDNKQN